jgi:hypothetical protein
MMQSTREAFPVLIHTVECVDYTQLNVAHVNFGQPVLNDCQQYQAMAALI